METSFFFEVLDLKAFPSSSCKDNQYCPTAATKTDQFDSNKGSGPPPATNLSMVVEILNTVHDMATQLAWKVTISSVDHSSFKTAKLLAELEPRNFKCTKSMQNFHKHLVRIGCASPSISGRMYQSSWVRHASRTRIQTNKMAFPVLNIWYAYASSVHTYNMIFTRVYIYIIYIYTYTMMYSCFYTLVWYLMFTPCQFLSFSDRSKDRWLPIGLIQMKRAGFDFIVEALIKFKSMWFWNTEDSGTVTSWVRLIPSPCSNLSQSTNSWRTQETLLPAPHWQSSEALNPTSTYS